MIDDLDEAALAAIARQATTPLALVDRSGLVWWSNPRFIALRAREGQALREHLGLTAASAVAVAAALAAATDGASTRLEVSSVDGAGHARTLALELGPYRAGTRVGDGAEPAPVAAVLSVHGVSARIAVEAAPARSPATLAEMQDLIETRQCELAPRAARTRVQSQLDATPLVAFDLRGLVTMVNDAGLALLGRAADELVGRSWFDAVVPEGPERIRARAAFQRVVDDVASEAERNYGEMPLPGFDDRVRSLAWRQAALHEGDGRRVGVLASGDDITARRELERRADRERRLDAIGRLAGGIAHDLNNALAPIMLSVEALRDAAPHEHEALDTLLESTRHARDVVRKLLTYARGSEGPYQPLAPSLVVRELEAIVHASFPENIDFVVCFGDDVPSVEGDATALHQVLLDLLLNARDALGCGAGRITLEVARVDVDASGPFVGVFQQGEPATGTYVLWRVSDTGSGIPPDQLEKIFEPFFTTKAPEHGTGLGLSAVLGIVKAHRGFIRVYTRPGRGSVFSVYLPALAEPTTAPPPARDGFRGDGELVLVVDDEPPVCAIAKRALERLNLQAVTAGSGPEALHVLRDRADVRVVITDLHMPEMNGVEFVRALRRTHADLPVVVSSGRLDDESRDAFESLGVKVSLEKPFTQAGLGDALRRCLA
jgi:PAS domain S-box-containing protein